MKRFVFSLLLLPLVAGGRLAAEDWIGLEQASPFAFGADLAVEDTGEYLGGVDFDLALGDGAGLFGNYRVYELSDDVEEFQSLALATAIWFELSELVDLEVSYFFEGNIDELEKENLGLALDFGRGNWNLRLQAEDGETRLFTRGDLGDVISRVIPERIDSDFVGYGLSLGWQGDDWYWQLSQQRFDYERDLSTLGSSDFAQFIVESSALAQSSLLVSKYTALLIGFADFENDYSLLLARDRSAIDDVDNDTLVLSWQHWASRSHGYLLAASFPESEDAGLALGLRWVM